MRRTDRTIPAQTLQHALRFLLVCCALAFAVAAACKPSEPPPPVGSPHQTDEAAPPGGLAVRISVPDDAIVPADGATLVVSWLKKTERWAADERRGVPPHLLPKIVARARIVTDTALAPGKTSTVRLPDARAAQQVMVLRAPPGQLWPTMLGARLRGNALVGASVDSDGATVSLSPATDGAWPRTQGRERCAGERMALHHVDAPEVAGRVGNPTRRRLCVVVPLSYAQHPQRRFPVVYLVPGLTSTDTAYLVGRENLAKAADRSGLDVILVGVDTSAVQGSTYLVDSSHGGNWERFLRDRVVPAIDARYRTVASGAGRALIGHSTGGFNAISYGLRYPETFGFIGASSPDGLDVADWLVDARGHVKPLWLAWTRLEAANGHTGQMVSYAAAWSADDSARGYAWPFDLSTGAVVPAVWRRWVAHSPIELLSGDRLARIERLLSGRIVITVPEADAFDLHAPAKRFSAALDRHGVRHRFEAPAGGHFDGSMDRLTGLLRAAATAMR